MASSTFEVTETEKDLTFGLETCDENGIGLSAQVDGEIQRDHTYTKDPDSSEEEEEKPNGEDVEESEKNNDLSPEKNRNSKNSKNTKNQKKNNPKPTKGKKEASPKKEVTPTKKNKVKKDVLAEESNKSEDSGKSEKSDEKNGTEEQAKSSKRGKKRKIEEKENVIDRSIVEEVQNINEGDSSADAGNASPDKKKKTTPEKPKSKKAAKPKKVASGADEDNQNLPKGWVRKEVIRKSGKTAGQVDIYIYSPDGIKFRSRPDIAAYLARTKLNLKLEDFNFSKKKASEDAPLKASPKKEKVVPAAKTKSSTEKKKPQSSGTPIKKGAKMVVKLNFTSKGKKGKNVKKAVAKSKVESKTSDKKTKTPGSNSKVSKKKKTA